MRSRILLSFLLIAIVAATLGCISSSQKTDAKDALAKCLTSKGAKMYGAYWCTHCKSQKDAWGSSFQYIDYVECDANGPNGNPAACGTAGIRSYPTWIIDGTKYEGEQEFGALTKLTGCAY